MSINRYALNDRLSAFLAECGWEGDPDDDERVNELVHEAGDLIDQFLNKGWEKAVVDKSLVLSFEPGAIRDHFDGTDVQTGLLTDEQIRLMGAYALADDRLYETFHEVLLDAMTEVLKGGTDEDVPSRL